MARVLSTRHNPTGLGRSVPRTLRTHRHTHAPLCPSCVIHARITSCEPQTSFTVPLGAWHARMRRRICGWLSQLIVS
eukprot:915127-Prymnesium_polylepis.1